MSASGDCFPSAWPYGYTPGEIPGGMVPGPGGYYFTRLPGSNPGNPLTKAPRGIHGIAELEKLFAKVWLPLVRRAEDAGGEDWLPKHRALPGGQVELIPAQLEEQLGCGYFGCVYDTNVENVVFKVTADEPEAILVQILLDMEANGISTPMGLVRYMGLFQMGTLKPSSVFSGSSYNAYGLWREKAYGIGDDWKHIAHTKGWPDSDFNEVSDRLSRLHVSGYEIKEYVASYGMKDTELVFEKYLSGSFYESFQLLDALRKFEFEAKKLAQVGVARLIGEAVLEFLRQGIVLADIHDDNIGHVYRQETGFKPGQLVIIDPGHCEFMSRGLVDVGKQIPAL